MSFVPGNQQRYLRACMVCSIVQVQQRFIREGCPNCETFLGLQNHPDGVQQCTSQVFEGLITLADPSQSWVARWQRLDGYVPGVYAVKVVGQVSCSLLSFMDIQYGARFCNPILLSYLAKEIDLDVQLFLPVHVSIVHVPAH